MVVRSFAICIGTMLSVFLFSACSWSSSENKNGELINVPSKWAELPKGEPFPWEDTDGFYPHEDNPYGFDRHTKPRAKMKEDSIVHASIASRSISIKFYKDEVKVTANEDGIAKLKVNKLDGLLFDYEYYICDPAFPETYLKSIDKSKTEQPYEFTNDMENDVKKLALCRKDKNDGVQIMQELYVHTYDWKEYKFLPVYYGKGDRNDDKNALVISYEFWDGVYKIYEQALVVPSLSNTLVRMNVQQGVTYARVRGVYSDNCTKGDIENIRLSIHAKMEEDKDLPRRVIFQLGLPTKRFWPLKKGSDEKSGNIEICGEPEEHPRYDYDYDMVPIAQLKDECSYFSNTTLRWNSEDNKLYLRFNGGEPVLATNAYFEELNLNARCLGITETFPDPLGRQYVEELRSSNTLATTIIDREKSFAFIILPWRGDDTKPVAYHELGHTMGLGDVLTDLPGTGDDNSKSEQGNLMFYKTQLGHKLRQRSIEIKDNENTSGFNTSKGSEKQWDCLQRKSSENSCANQNWLSF